MESHNQVPAQERFSKIRLGVSACLLGEPVRFNGGHSRDRFVSREIEQMVDYVPVCPEVEVGMGAPREALRLVRIGENTRLVASNSGRDHTEAMKDYARRKAAELAALDLDGFVLKKDSPSCGMERVKVYDSNGAPSKSGRGLFAEEMMRRAPLLPVEEEGRLNDPRLRENFFVRVFAYRRLRELFSRSWTPGELVKFHAREKFLLQAHNPAAQRALGRLAARVRELPREELARRYQELFMKALSKPARPRGHVNVLQHMAGFFKRRLEGGEKRELAALIEDFRAGLTPLPAPMTLVRHHMAKFKTAYLAQQTYLAPAPKSLLRGL